MYTKEKVSGIYYEVPFAGVIYSERFLQLSIDCQEIKVLLDKPITIYGQIRDSILLYSNPKYVKDKPISCITEDCKEWY